LRIEPRAEKVGEMVAIPLQICTEAVFERATTWVLCEARL
jgi:hypothetical protein